MTARIVPRATFTEVLAFLKSRGVTLSDEGRRLLREKLDKNPVGKPALERARIMVTNPIFKDILDRTLVKRSERIQRITENNPLLQLIEETREKILKKPEEPMPVALRRVFYDDSRWQLFFPYMSVPPSGQIVKVQETSHPDLPYIGFLKVEEEKGVLYTTSRKTTAALHPQTEVKYFRLKEGVFRYEKDEVKELEQEYLNYIMQFHRGTAP